MPLGCDSVNISFGSSISSSGLQHSPPPSQPCPHCSLPPLGPFLSHPGMVVQLGRKLLQRRDQTGSAPPSHKKWSLLISISSQSHSSSDPQSVSYSFAVGAGYGYKLHKSLQPEKETAINLHSNSVEQDKSFTAQNKLEGVQLHGICHG